VSWSCPTCARTFARENQFHSHDTVGVDAHFAGRPERLRESFDKLIGSLPSDVQVEALTSVIAISARRTFAYIVVQDKRLRVGVFLEHALDSPRVVKIDHISLRKFGSLIDVGGPGEVDDELQQWLRQAYLLCPDAGRARN
jgi:predicted transport protein